MESVFCFFKISNVICFFSCFYKNRGGKKDKEIRKTTTETMFIEYIQGEKNIVQPVSQITRSSKIRTPLTITKLSTTSRSLTKKLQVTLLSFVLV